MNRRTAFCRCRKVIQILTLTKNNSRTLRATNLNMSLPRIKIKFQSIIRQLMTVTLLIILSLLSPRRIRIKSRLRNTLCNTKLTPLNLDTVSRLFSIYSKIARAKNIEFRTMMRQTSFTKF